MGRTVKEWLEGLSEAEESTEEDRTKMQNLLRRSRFPDATVTEEGVRMEGDPNTRPMDIHKVAARVLVSTAEAAARKAKPVSKKKQKKGKK